jgi:glucose-1-phosphate thymidylyltransferase
VLISRDFLGDDPFVMYLGDNLVLGGIADLVTQFTADPADALLLLAKVEHPEQFGVAELDPAGRIVRLVEKPAVPVSDLALVGVYLFGPPIHTAVQAIAPSARGELEITDAIGWLVEHGHAVRTHLLTQPWVDTGKVTDLLEANRVVLSGIERAIRGSVDDASEIVGNVVVETGAEIVRSQVHGPAVVGRNARVVDSSVGPHTSIGPGCTIVDSEVGHSVLLEGATIEGVRSLADSLIGRHAHVARSTETPPAYRMLVADDSDIRLV